MRKRLAIFGCVALLLFGWPRMAENQQSGTHAAKHVASTNNQPPPPTHVIIDPPFPQFESLPKPTDNSGESQEKPLPQFVRPEWVIVYVTVAYSVITLFMWLTIKRQAEIMENQARDIRESSARTFDQMQRQANMMERQITLQETLSQQWVEVSDWRKEGFGSRELNPPRFTIAAEIRNPTQAPLTIQFAYIGTPGKPLMEYEIKRVLAPGGSSEKITYSGEVEASMIRAYDMGQFPVVIQGKVMYTDCFGKDRFHPFRQACFLGPGNRLFSRAISELEHPIPDPHINQNPN